MAVGSSGNDYDILAAPVAPATPHGTAKKPIPRLYFAGEYNLFCSYSAKKLFTVQNFKNNIDR